MRESSIWAGEQGKGIRYASSGRELFEGQFARDHIQYESLLGLSLEDAEVMLKETPIVYYSEGETSFLYEKNKVILRADCLVELKLSGTDSAEGTGCIFRWKTGRRWRRQKKVSWMRRILLPGPLKEPLQNREHCHRKENERTGTYGEPSGR